MSVSESRQFTRREHASLAPDAPVACSSWEPATAMHHFTESHSKSEQCIAHSLAFFPPRSYINPKMDVLPFPPTPTPTPHRHRPPSTPPVFLRDFAYDSAVSLLPEQMRASGRSIRTANARTFAQYVRLPLAP